MAVSPLLDHAAVLEDHDAVRPAVGHTQVVGDQQQGGAGIPYAGLQQVEDLLLDGDVEGGGGFVGDDERRVADQRQGDEYALALSTGELVRVAARVHRRVQADVAQGFGGPTDRVPASPAVQAERLGELAADRAHGVEPLAGVLRDVADVQTVEPVPRRRPCGGDVATQDAVV